ncbi:MAG TPA: twin transmembrane helix small protein [Steroidobacteraceae bacterium]|nr:twin transmembrane helix small protein [Steroidobacteraceae bacterium]
MELVKVLVIVLLGLIVTSLGKAMFHMSSGPEDSAKTVQALTFRIGLSVALFILLFVAWYAGALTPHAGP